MGTGRGPGRVHDRRTARHPLPAAARQRPGHAQAAFVSNTGSGALGLLLLVLVLAILKPLATTLCLGGGATGGLFTPTLSTGAVLGAALGTIWNHLWPGAPVGGYALIVPIIAATALATTVGRYLDGYSIYSSRLPAQSPLSS